MPPTEPSPELSSQRGAPPQKFECEVRRSGRAAVWLQPHGELDLASASQFEQVLRVALESGVLIIVDLRQLAFIDSAGVHVIIAAQAQARRNARRLVILCDSGPVARMFEVLRLSNRVATTGHLKAASGPAQTLTVLAPSDDGAR